MASQQLMTDKKQKPAKSIQHQNFERVGRAVSYLLDNQQRQPSLAELSSVIGIGESHLQRTFLEWVGVSPKQFLLYLTKEKAKQALQSNSVFDAALASGLSGGGRLHDLMVRHECVTPGEYQSKGEGLEISYGVHSSPLGSCFIATTPRGICKLSFLDSDADADLALEELLSGWGNARITADPHETALQCDAVFSTLTAGGERRVSDPIHLLLRATPFRIQVWEALMQIPPGRIVSYQQVACAIGKPKAVRAVASAIANNEIGLLIPCHRVIRESGALSEYRWSRHRKAALIGYEFSLNH